MSFGHRAISTDGCIDCGISGEALPFVGTIPPQRQKRSQTASVEVDAIAQIHGQKPKTTTLGLFVVRFYRLRRAV